MGLEAIGKVPVKLAETGGKVARGSFSALRRGGEALSKVRDITPAVSKLTDAAPKVRGGRHRIRPISGGEKGSRPAAPKARGGEVFTPRGAKDGVRPAAPKSGDVYPATPTDTKTPRSGGRRERPTGTGRRRSGSGPETGPVRRTSTKDIDSAHRRRYGKPGGEGGPGPGRGEGRRARRPGGGPESRPPRAPRTKSSPDIGGAKRKLADRSLDRRHGKTVRRLSKLDAGPETKEAAEILRRTLEREGREHPGKLRRARTVYQAGYDRRRSKGLVKEQGHRKRQEGLDTADARMRARRRELGLPERRPTRHVPNKGDIYTDRERMQHIKDHARKFGETKRRVQKDAREAQPHGKVRKAIHKGKNELERRRIYHEHRAGKLDAQQKRKDLQRERRDILKHFWEHPIRNSMRIEAINAQIKVLGYRIRHHGRGMREHSYVHRSIRATGRTAGRAVGLQV